jgi:hypothetical protein
LISLQTTTLLNSPKYRIAFQSTKLTRKLSWIFNHSLLSSTKIKSITRPTSTDPSTSEV